MYVCRSVLKELYHNHVNCSINVLLKVVRVVESAALPAKYWPKQIEYRKLM